MTALLGDLGIGETCRYVASLLMGQAPGWSLAQHSATQGNGRRRKPSSVIF